MSALKCSPLDQEGWDEFESDPEAYMLIDVLCDAQERLADALQQAVEGAWSETRAEHGPTSGWRARLEDAQLDWQRVLADVEWLIQQRQGGER